MAKHGKSYNAAAEKIDRATLYTPLQAAKLIKELDTAKFDETVELHVKLGVDSRHADQQVRGAIVLPNGTGKSVRVLVFALEVAELKDAWPEQHQRDAEPSTRGLPFLRTDCFLAFPWLRHVDLLAPICMEDHDAGRTKQDTDSKNGLLIHTDSVCPH